MSQEGILQPVGESVGYALKRATAALRASMDNALRPIGMTVPQYACLEVLRQRPGLSGSELARAVFVSRQAMNLLLKGLEDRGLLTRPSTPSYGKALPTELTPAGRERLLAANQALSAVENRMLAALAPGTHHRLCADLASIADALSCAAEPGED